MLLTFNNCANVPEVTRAMTIREQTPPQGLLYPYLKRSQGLILTPFGAIAEERGW